MKKTIKILSFVSLFLVILSSMLIVMALTFLWEPFCYLFSYSEMVVNARPIIPIGSVVYICGCISISAILIATNKSKVTIVLDIILIVIICSLLPIIDWILTIIQITIIYSILIVCI